MGVTITRVENAGPDLRARRLIFDDFSDPRTTAAAVVKQLSLVVGSVVEHAELERALHEAERLLARERALQLLGYRERSAFEVESKLRDNGYPASVAKSVVTRFVEVELIDDSRFAQAWARSRVAAGYGSRRIKTELSRKGVEDIVAAAALEDLEEPGTELERARESLRGRVPADERDRQRMVRRLVTRGFELRIALAAVSEDAETPKS